MELCPISHSQRQNPNPDLPLPPSSPLSLLLQGDYFTRLQRPTHSQSKTGHLAQRIWEILSPPKHNYPKPHCQGQLPSWSTYCVLGTFPAQLHFMLTAALVGNMVPVPSLQLGKQTKKACTFPKVTHLVSSRVKIHIQSYLKSKPIPLHIWLSSQV